MRGPNILRHAAVLGLTVLIAPGLATPARAQRTPDPYNIVGEGNLGYQEYMYSTYPNGIGFSPNQGVVQGRSGLGRANQFQNYIQELDGVGSDSDGPFNPSGRNRGGIEPYYRAHREFDQSFNRVYAPNELADKTYYQDQRARTEKYLEYLRESDPKKRAQLYREYNKQSLKSARDFSTASTRAALRGDTSARSSISTSPLPSESSLTAPRPSSATGSSPLRRPSSSSRTAPGRPRGALTSPSGASSSETPAQILDRAELLDRANRTTRPSPTRTPGPTRPATR